MKGLFANIEGTSCTSKWPFANIHLVTIRDYTALAIHVRPPDRIKGNAPCTQMQLYGTHILYYTGLVVQYMSTMSIPSPSGIIYSCMR